MKQYPSRRQHEQVLGQRRKKLGSWGIKGYFFIKKYKKGLKMEYWGIYFGADILEKPRVVFGGNFIRILQSGGFVAL
ncbi:MAG: hypothetical protein JSV99_11305 [Planctomycetota bacterium]|nr:MAG: hypothetical protein JSV99_11305 [Planctomycetota bacterium]